MKVAVRYPENALPRKSPPVAFDASRTGAQSARDSVQLPSATLENRLGIKIVGLLSANAEGKFAIIIAALLVLAIVGRHLFLAPCRHVIATAR